MFGTSGIRGPVGEEVTASLALSVGRAVGTTTDRVVVGHDPRESGRLLTDALAAGLRELGTDVVDLGVAATPTVARAVRWLDGDGGIAVTASHNPPADNGIKLWEPSGKAFGPARREAIAERVSAAEFDLRPWDELGHREQATVRDQHVRTLNDAVELTGTPSVIVDVGNGAGGLTIDALTSLGCEVETLNAQPDGAFPGRPSEPTAEHCASLATLVGETDADVGIAHDGDADRMRAVAADGTFLSGDVTLALFAADAAAPGQRVAIPIDTSLAVEDYLAERDVGVIRTAVGDVHVAEATTADEVVFGGEPSGAWIWPDQTLCPDGPLAACRLVQLDADRPLEDRIAEVPTYPIRRTTIEAEDKAVVMDQVRTAVQSQYDTVDTLDGVRVSLGDAWFLLRASGTQPVIRITAEARRTERMEEVYTEAETVLKDCL